MVYAKSHTINDCDKCCKKASKLFKVPFLYLDHNDHVHDDAIPYDPRYKDYKQYWVCEECRKNV